MKSKKKLIITLATIAVLAVATIGGTLAYFTDKDTRTNVITFGKVDGTLTETDEETRPDGTTGQDFTNIKPGDELAKDPKVTVASDSEDAYARISITYTGLTDTQITELEAALQLNEGWSKSTDGYFYYNNIMKPNDESKIFDEVTIPSTWGNEVASMTFNMVVNAELIQADNFTPTVDPVTGNIISWGDVNIQEAVTTAVPQV